VRFAIEKANVRVGADETNDLVVRGDDFVSRKHASIRFEAGSLYLNDLDSSNGTFLNGTRLGQGAVALSPGDTVRFGRTTFEVRRADDTGAAAKSPEHERRVP
jgi:pSer/pThr/pTyr-binding forkhead associated (FHA) protein